MLLGFLSVNLGQNLGYGGANVSSRFDILYLAARHVKTKNPQSLALFGKRFFQFSASFSFKFFHIFSYPSTSLRITLSPSNGLTSRRVFEPARNDCFSRAGIMPSTIFTELHVI